MSRVSFWSTRRFISGAGSGTGSFQSHTKIPRPSVDPYEINVESQATYQVLADGTQARLIPDVKHNILQPIEFRWSYPKSFATVVDNLFQQLKEYERMDQGVELTLHTDDKIKGFFRNVRAQWLLQGAVQTRSVFAAFQPMTVDDTNYVMTGAKLFI